MVTGGTIEQCEVELGRLGIPLVVSGERRQLLGLRPLAREPRSEVDRAGMSLLVALPIPMGWQAAEISVELEAQPRMAGSDQVVIDSLHLTAGLAWTEVT